MAAAGALAACGGPAEPATPRSTVATYFGAMADHRTGAAERLLAPPAQRQGAEDLQNTAALWDLRLHRVERFSHQGLPGAAGYRDLTQVIVSYDARYRRVEGSTDGSQGRFVWVGRWHGSGPWRILGVGTGP